MAYFASEPFKHELEDEVLFRQCCSFVVERKQVQRQSAWCRGCVGAFPGEPTPPHDVHCRYCVRETLVGKAQVESPFKWDQKPLVFFAIIEEGILIGWKTLRMSSNEHLSIEAAFAARFLLEVGYTFEGPPKLVDARRAQFSGRAGAVAVKQQALVVLRWLKYHPFIHCR
jgi:hypothetical protein